MAAPVVRSDYDQLGQVAQRFATESEATRATLQALRQNMAVLEGGDWIGQGASAFYAEMSDSVLPAVQRLADALQTAQQVTQAIRGAMQQAEDAAAAVFRQMGAGSGTPTLAGAAGGFGTAAGVFAASAATATATAAAGLWQAAADPAGDLQGLLNALALPEALWNGFQQPFAAAFANGQPAQAISRGALFAAAPFAGGATSSLAPAGAGQPSRATLQQMLVSGAAKLDFPGNDVEQTLLDFEGQPADALPAHVQDMRYVMDNAAQYGYVPQGSSFVRVMSGDS